MHKNIYAKENVFRVMAMFFLFTINCCANDGENASERIIGQWRSEPTLGQLGHTILTCFFGKNGEYWESTEFVDANRIPTEVSQGTYKVEGSYLIITEVSRRADDGSPTTNNHWKVSFYFDDDELVLVEEYGYRLKKIKKEWGHKEKNLSRSTPNLTGSTCKKHSKKI